MQDSNNKLFGKVTGNWKDAIKFSLQIEVHFGLVGSVKTSFAVIYEKSIFLTNY